MLLHGQSHQVFNSHTKASIPPHGSATQRNHLSAAQALEALQQPSATPSSTDAVSQIAIPLHLLASPVLRPLVATPAFIAQLGALLRAAWGARGAATRYAGLGPQLQDALEKLLVEEVMRTQGKAIMDTLVPDLCVVRVAVCC